MPMSVVTKGRKIALGAFALTFSCTKQSAESEGRSQPTAAPHQANAPQARAQRVCEEPLRHVISDLMAGSPVISADGRHVAFHTLSPLVTADTNGTNDVFVVDPTTGAVSRASALADGAQSKGDSRAAQLSGDGQFVVFESEAEYSTQGGYKVRDRYDIFVRDRRNGTVARAPNPYGHGPAANAGMPTVSSSGTRVAYWVVPVDPFTGVATASGQIQAWEPSSGRLRLVTRALDGNPASGTSTFPHLSPDGRFVAFQSDASNLVSGDINETTDVFLADLEKAKITRVSIDSQGADLFQASHSAQASADGRFVAFVTTGRAVPNDNNGAADVYIRNMMTGEITLASPRISVDRADHIREPSLSADGQRVAFSSLATNLVQNDTNGWSDVFVFDQRDGQVRRVSISGAGEQGNDGSHSPQISADGRYVLFQSGADNFVAGVKPNTGHLYIVDLDKLAECQRGLGRATEH